MQPKDSPIWNFLQKHHPDLPEPIKQKTFDRLQESAVPATDKIFPWIVVAVINRVIEELLQGDLKTLRREIEKTPKQIGRQMAVDVKSVLIEPVQEIRSARTDIRSLTQELRASAVLESSLSQSGWKGIGTAISSITRLDNLRVVVAGMMGTSFLIGIGIANGFAAGDREIIQFNRGVIQDCHQNYAADVDKNGWYTCPKFQLPMPQK